MRLDNLLLDQMRENTIRTIKDKATKENIDRIEQAQQSFDRTLQLKFQLDKLDRQFNENMPPPTLNIMDKLQFRSKELTNEIRDQYSEQYHSKDQTGINIYKENRENSRDSKERENTSGFETNLPRSNSYSRDKAEQKKRKETEFFRAKSEKNNRKIARAKEKNSTAKNLHLHFTVLGFPPQVNNKVLSLTEEERRTLNYGPKFVPSNPKQALDRLEK